MTRPLVILFLLITGGAIPPSVAENLLDNVSFRGMASSEVAIGLSEGNIQKWDFTLRPEMNMDLNDNLRLTAIGMARLEAIDHLEPGRPKQHMRSQFSQSGYIGDLTELSLRELYLDTSIGETYLRLGKQQIVWGQADGLRVLDMVNPFHYREFILDDFEDRRIPLWSVNLEIPLGDIMTQVIWLPDQTYDHFPEADAAYAITSPRFIPDFPPQATLNFASPKKPSRFIADSDIGIRLSSFLKGWDLTLNYLYHYQDRSIFFQNPIEDTIILSPEYRRSHLIGGTFSNAFGSFTLRGELGYSTNRYFLSQNAKNLNGVHSSDEFSYVIGLDYNGIDDSFLSIQFFQSILTSHTAGLFRDKAENQMTVLVERRFMNETLKAKALLIQSLNDGDGIFEFDLSYELRDNITIEMGTDIFYGTRNGLFGQFSQNDRMTLSIDVGF